MMADALMLIALAANRTEQNRTPSQKDRKQGIVTPSRTPARSQTNRTGEEGDDPDVVVLHTHKPTPYASRCAVCRLQTTDCTGKKGIQNKV
jgi:hypothetical protein